MAVLTTLYDGKTPAIREDPPRSKERVAQILRALRQNNSDITRQQALVCACKTMLGYIADDDVDLAWWELMRATD